MVSIFSTKMDDHGVLHCSLFYQPYKILSHGLFIPVSLLVGKKLLSVRGKSCYNKPTSKCIMAHVQSKFLSCPYETHTRCSGLASFSPPQGDAGASIPSITWLCFLQHIALQISVFFSYQIGKENESGGPELGAVYELPLTTRQSGTRAVAVGSRGRVDGSGDRLV